jgi:S1-C subfamily serine protease
MTVLRPLLLIAVFASGCGRLPEHRGAGTTAGQLAPRHVASVDRAVAFRILTIDLDTYQRGNASACFVAPDGVAVTCAHVVAGEHVEPLTAVLPDGTRSEFEIEAVDTAHDLALIRVDGLNGPSAFMPVSAREPVRGESLWTVTKAGVGRADFRGKLVDPEVGEAFELATMLGPGASGGAIVNADGTLVGVIRGAVDDDPGPTVAITASRVAEMMAGRQAE